MNQVRKIIGFDESIPHFSHSCIAILDSGIAPHPDFENRIVVWRDFLHSRSTPYDDNGHGTHVAGIAAGSGQMSHGLYRGISPESPLVILKILNSRGEGSIQVILAALNWILRHKKEYNIRIVNISVGATNGKHFPESSPLVQKVNALWDAGIIVVASAGNNGPRSKTISAPGNSRKIITVGYYAPNCNSSVGPTALCVKKPDVIAPGLNICSCSHRLFAREYYTKKSGTSMATPIVSGSIALYLSQNPDASPKDVKKQLKTSCKDLGLPHSKQGWGLLNLPLFLR